MSMLEEALKRIKDEAIAAHNAKITQSFLNRDQAKFFNSLKTDNFHANQKVQGKSKDGTMRHLAEIPEDVYFRMTELHGPDYFRKMENIRKHKQFQVVERI